MDVLQGSIDLFEKILISLVRPSAGLADVKMMNLPVEHVLESFTLGWEIEFLDDIQLLEGFQISINARPVHASEFGVQKSLDVLKRDLLILIVQDELKHDPSGRRYPHFVGLQNVREIFMLFHEYAF